MSEPGLSLRFTVVIDGQVRLGDWTKCEGLSVEYDVFEYKEGGNNGFIHRLPGRAKYTNIKLSRPIDDSSAAVAGWLASVQARVNPSTAAITVLDSDGSPVTTWNLIGVYPAKWTGPTLDVGSNTAAMETLELVHNGFMAVPL
jgi:phage tail-like protein